MNIKLEDKSLEIYQSKRKKGKRKERGRGRGKGKEGKGSEGKGRVGKNIRKTENTVPNL